MKEGRDSMIEAVVCVDCKNDLTMSVSSDTPVTADKWIFRVECISHNEVKMCCAEKIAEGIHLVLDGLKMFSSMSKKSIDVEFSLPKGMRIEEEE